MNDSKSVSQKLNESEKKLESPTHSSSYIGDYFYSSVSSSNSKMSCAKCTLAGYCRFCMNYKYTNHRHF